MLFGGPSNRPNLQRVRRIKAALYEALDLPEDALITVSQLACIEQGCAPLETVFGLLRKGQPQQQHKIHKKTDAIDATDLIDVCQAWGFSVPVSVFEPIFTES